MLSLSGLLVGLILLMVLTMRGMNLFLASALCALLVALTGGLALAPQIAAEGQADALTAYMRGFSGFIANWFFMFLLGAVFGKLMEDSGAADSVSRWIIGHLGMRRAALAVVAACAVLTYGGVSLFVVAFSVYPMALSLFRQADLPRRFIPATLAFGSVTFTMTSAGSPEIQNWIPIPYLGTTHLAAWQASLVVAVFMAVLGHFLLSWQIRRALARGERFQARADDPQVIERRLPHPALAGLPLAIVLVVAFLWHDSLGTSALILALAGGCLAAWLLQWRQLGHSGGAFAAGSIGALVAIGNTAAVVGFGAVAQAVPGFDIVVQALTSLPGNGLLAAAVAVSVIAGMTGSASGGQVIALPILAPHFLAQGVNPDQLHRVVAISSGVLDSLPHNGYVVTTIRAICGESHRAAYGPMAMMTIVVPLLGLVLCFGLFALGW